MGDAGNVVVRQAMLNDATARLGHAVGVNQRESSQRIVGDQSHMVRVLLPRQHKQDHVPKLKVAGADRTDRNRIAERRCDAKDQFRSVRLSGVGAVRVKMHSTVGVREPQQPHTIKAARRAALMHERNPDVAAGGFYNRTRAPSPSGRGSNMGAPCPGPLLAPGTSMAPASPMGISGSPRK